MITSLNGIKFIAAREACVTVAYPDGKRPDGTAKYSIGFGSQTPEVKEGETITQEMAFTRLQNDLRDREAIINRKLSAEIAQPQYDMLMSLFYQAGSKALSTVAALYNAEQPWLAILAHGQFTNNASPGIIRRRVMEMHIAATGNYGDLSKYPLYDGDPRKVEKQWWDFPPQMQEMFSGVS